MKFCAPNIRVQSFYIARIILHKYSLPDKGFPCILTMSVTLSSYLSDYLSPMPPLFIHPFPLKCLLSISKSSMIYFFCLQCSDIFSIFFLKLLSHLSYSTPIDLFTKLVKGNTLMLFFVLVLIPSSYVKDRSSENILFCTCVKLCFRISKNFFHFDKNNSIV